jgi:hypothetical protein
MRDWVKAWLNETGLGGKWLSLSPNGGFWPFYFELKNSTAELENITDDGFNPFRKHNFTYCGGKITHGHEIRYADGDNHGTVFTCKERGCVRCYDKDKAKTALRWHNRIMAVHEAHPDDIDRFHGFVFTIPREVEHVVRRGEAVYDTLIDRLNKLNRKALGFKTRDNVFGYCQPHAVGDRDIMRDRMHFHFGYLAMCLCGPKGDKQLVTKQVRFSKADLRQIRLDYQKILVELFGDAVAGKANFKYKHIPLGLKKSPAVLAHRLKYDLRGFGRDVMKAPILYDPERRLVVVAKGEEGYGVYTTDQLAARWQWIRKQRNLRSFGVLHSWKASAPFLGLEWMDDPEPDVDGEDVISVYQETGRAWIPNPEGKGGKVKFVDKRTGIRQDGSVMPEDTPWGRKGSEGYWDIARPDESPQTDDQAPSGDATTTDLVQGWLPGVERPAEGEAKVAVDLGEWWRSQWVE